MIPWPKEAVARGHLPQLNFNGFPISWISKFISSKRPILDKNDSNFFSPIFWAILTEPIFPDRINIWSAVKFVGISSSYSLILNPAQVNDFGKSTNSVSGSIIFSLKAAAKVKVLKTEPNSYTPLDTLFI